MYCKIIFENENKIVDAKKGVNLLEIMRQHQIAIEAPCNKNGKCNKCMVEIKKNNTSDEYIKMLSCKFMVSENISVKTIEVINDLIGVSKGRVVKGYDLPSLKLISLGKLDFSDIYPYTNKIPGKKFTLNILKKIAIMEIKKYQGKVLGVYMDEELIDILYGVNIDENIYGLGIDLGTTGISVSLLNLSTGIEIKSLSTLNPQVDYGGDVLTRVSFCMEKTENIELLQRILIEKINEIIHSFKNINPENIYGVVISGNTIMEHIAAGVNPTTLSKNPYRSIFNYAQRIELEKLRVNPNAVITLLPTISSYIGGDILGGIISSDFCNDKRNILFIDMGTNGEIVLNWNNNLYGTSTAAGPALEGMNISCGMRAVNGALEKVSINDDGNFIYSVIGNEKCKGICGSGLIDLCAMLLKAGIINKRGNIVGVKDKKFYINEEVYINQKDIRQIQLAKGAICAGIKMLLDDSKGLIESIEEIFIAGSFGYHLNPENILNIGIIPSEYKGKISFIGNTSLEGAKLALLHSEIIEKMENLRGKIKPVELSNRDNFQDYFVKELGF